VGDVESVTEKARPTTDGAQLVTWVMSSL